MENPAISPNTRSGTQNYSIPFSMGHRIGQILKRLISIFSRFRAANLILTGPSVALRRQDGGRAGEISAVSLRKDRLYVQGKAPGGPVTLSIGQMSTSTTLPTSGGSFRLELPRPTDLPLNRFRADLTANGLPSQTVRLFSPGPALLALGLRFAFILLQLSPDILRWMWRKDPHSKNKIKSRLGLNTTAVTAGPLPKDLFTASDLHHVPNGEPIIIVLPVFNAHDLLTECLKRISRHTDLPWTLIAIDDGSDDPQIRPVLKAFEAAHSPGQVRLLLKEKNAGFITSVNSAFETILAENALSDRPVILLNTDAWVPADWASRLIAPLRQDTSIASVTPMSNDAEIFSVPAICTRQNLRPGQAEAIDALARDLPPDPTLAEAPTGVGFCMALSPQYLRKVPQFDTAFGRGYGEEVDWCQKVRALGGRHVGTARLFVEHHGGSSFGTDEKRALIDTNNRIVTARYPSYDREVQDFLSTDPLRAPRLALAVAWAASATPGLAIPIYIAHSLGGGAEHWLHARIHLDAEEGVPSIVLRVGGSARWQIEVWGPHGNTAGWTDDTAQLHQLLSPLKQRRIIYSCGVGDRDPIELPDLMLSLRGAEHDQIEVLFHDYLPISPSFTLLDGNGKFHGVVTPERLQHLSANTVNAHQIPRPNGITLPLSEWQSSWGSLLHEADVIRVFSPSAAQFVSEVWPELSARVTVRPHHLLTDIPHLDPFPESQPPVLAVLGNIAPHKGARLVQELANLSPQHLGAKLILIGNIDPEYPLSRKIRVHGDYTPADIPALVAHYGITHWLIPSVWPETFSFTTHEALATGRPVLAFDIGAQGDAVFNADNGIALPYRPDADHAALVVNALKQLTNRA